MKIKVKKLTENAVIPQFAHSTDSGFDLFTSEDLTIPPHTKATAKTGLTFEIPTGFGIQIKNKSGITLKGVPIEPKKIEVESLEFFNGYPTPYINTEIKEKADITIYEGTIDMDYRGEIMIMLKNEEDFEITIPKHTKLAQGIIRKVYHCEFVEVDEVNETQRGEGGFGSTGTKLKKA